MIDCVQGTVAPVGGAPVSAHKPDVRTDIRTLQILQAGLLFQSAAGQ